MIQNELNELKSGVTLKVLLLSVLLICILRCSSVIAQQDDDGFGKIRNTSGYGAIDGISGFVHLLKSKGLSVRPSSRISPRIDRYETIIWAPDRDTPPRTEAIQRLERWVSEGYGSRRLIFIGPGFRSRGLLEKKQVEIAEGEDLERAQRRFNEKIIEYGYDDWYRWLENESCDWYDITEIKNQPVKKLSGPWSRLVRSGNPKVYTGVYKFDIPAHIRPNSSAQQSKATVLLKGDGKNLLYNIPVTTPFGDTYGIDEGSGIFVLANGSFVQNYGLVNQDNQKLARRLADECSGNVLVLQSGPGQIEVTDSLAPENNDWAWLKQEPLRGMVPFFLLFATFVFFVVFPIHGRPRRIRLRPEKTFGDHIRATGQLIKASKGKEWAQRILEKYYDGSSDKKSG